MSKKTTKEINIDINQINQYWKKLVDGVESTDESKEKEEKPDLGHKYRWDDGKKAYSKVPVKENQINIKLSQLSGKKIEKKKEKQPLFIKGSDVRLGGIYLYENDLIYVKLIDDEGGGFFFEYNKLGKNLKPLKRIYNGYFYGEYSLFLPAKTDEKKRLKLKELV